MKYLHTMVRVTDLDQSLRFYCDALGLREVRRYDNEQGRFTLVFLAAPGDESAQVELTFNWDPEPYGIGRAFGHLAYEVDDVYAACQRLMDHGVTNQPSAARRPHGLRALAGPHLGRAAAEGRRAAARRTVAQHAEHRRLVSAAAEDDRFTTARRRSAARVRVSGRTAPRRQRRPGAPVPGARRRSRRRGLPAPARVARRCRRRRRGDLASRSARSATPRTACGGLLQRMDGRVGVLVVQARGERLVNDGILEEAAGIADQRGVRKLPPAQASHGRGHLPGGRLRCASAANSSRTPA